MHSKERALRHYPELFPYISSLYHQELNETSQEFLQKYNNVNMDDFGKYTSTTDSI